MAIKLPKTSAPRAPAPPKSAIPAPPAPTLGRSKPAPPPPAPTLGRSKPALAKLKNRADELNSITDQTADMVRDVEDFLSIECSIGFKASVTYTSTIFGLKNSLEYVRIGKSFRIAVAGNPIMNALSKNQDAKAWSDCSRAEKVESIQHLPVLIEAITKKVEEEVATAEAAAITVSEVLRSLIGNEG